MKIWRIIFLYIVIIVPILTACSNGPSSLQVSLNKTALTLGVDEEETLIATVTAENTPRYTVTWSSSDTSKVTVDANGRVKGIALTTTGVYVRVTVTGGDLTTSDACFVTVTVPVTGIALNKTSLILGVDEEETLTAVISPENAIRKTVTWSSSDTSRVTVDANGKVKGVAFSSEAVTVTATTADGGFTSTCAVTVGMLTVNLPPVSQGKVEASGASTFYGSGAKFTAEGLNPDNSPVQTVTWAIHETVDAGTSITGGVLSVAAADHGRTLTVKAISMETGMFGTARVTVVSCLPSDFLGTWVRVAEDYTITVVVSAGILETKNDRVDPNYPNIPYHYRNSIQSWGIVWPNNSINYPVGYWIYSTVAEVLEGTFEAGDDYNIPLYLHVDKNSFAWLDDTAVFIKQVSP
jgi:hypothetical protein